MCATGTNGAMGITLMTVNNENIDKCLGLELTDEQMEFVPPNHFFLDNPEYDGWHPLCIYHGTNMVGFASYGKDPCEQELWRVHVMIDRRHQGKGYGKTAIRWMMNHITDSTGAGELNFKGCKDHEAFTRICDGLGYDLNGNGGYVYRKSVLK